MLSSKDRCPRCYSRLINFDQKKVLFGQIFLYADCCGLRKWTYFSHVFRLYLIFLAVSRFPKIRGLRTFPSLSQLRFAGIPLLITVCVAPVRCSKRLIKLVQVNNVRSFYTFDQYLSISGYSVDS